MTEADIPRRDHDVESDHFVLVGTPDETEAKVRALGLRDQIAYTLRDARRASAPFLSQAIVLTEADFDVADALLEHFDITPRGSLPVNEEP